MRIKSLVFGRLDVHKSVRVQNLESDLLLGPHSRAGDVKLAKSLSVVQTDDQLAKLVALEFVDRFGVIDHQRELLPLKLVIFTELYFRKDRNSSSRIERLTFEVVKFDHNVVRQICVDSLALLKDDIDHLSFA